jgi:hypothetical protein
MLKQTPMMANPHEYRDLLWTVLHEGRSPDTSGTDYEPGGETPQSAFEEMEAMKRAAIAARETGEA